VRLVEDTGRRRNGKGEGPVKDLPQAGPEPAERVIELFCLGGRRVAGLVVLDCPLDLGTDCLVDGLGHGVRGNPPLGEVGPCIGAFEDLDRVVVGPLSMVQVFPVADGDLRP
jgi:hypothetical protein